MADNKEVQTMPVILEDEELLKFPEYVLLYADSEGSPVKVLAWMGEDEIDRCMKEFERNGTITYDDYAELKRVTLFPIVAMKAKVTRALRKEFRCVEMEKELPYEVK